MAKYKIHLDPESNELTQVTFDQLKEIKGIKSLGQSAAAARAARARLVSTRVFKGISPFTNRPGARKTLDDFVGANDVAGYVKAWRAINHLTQ